MNARASASNSSSSGLPIIQASSTTAGGQEMRVSSISRQELSFSTIENVDLDHLRISFQNAVASSLDSGKRQFAVIVERHADGYVAYPLGIKGTVIGQGDTYSEVIADVTSAIRFHIETFGEDVLDTDDAPIDVFVARVGV